MESVDLSIPACVAHGFQFGNPHRSQLGRTHAKVRLQHFPRRPYLPNVTTFGVLVWKFVLINIVLAIQALC